MLHSVDKGCPNPELLIAMVEGALDETKRDWIERHIDACQICATLVIDLVAVSEPANSAMPETIGRYQLQAMIGRGGMGEVWSAWDPQLTRMVAIKRVRHDMIDDRGRAALIKEARALAAVAHPNVVAVYDAGEDGGEVFIATELIDGETLAQWQLKQGWPAIVAAWAQAARGLAAVHQRSIIHRDVKATNILVGSDSRARIGDFGIARHQIDAGGSAGFSLANTKTNTGFLSGTPGFMAPELLRGEPFGASVDQFSLCVGLGETLIGKRPIAGEILEFSISPQLAQIISRGLAIKPADRYASMTELAQQLESLPAFASPTNKPVAKSRYYAFYAVVASVIIVVATMSIMWLRSQPDSGRNDPASSPAPTARVSTPNAQSPAAVIAGTPVAPADAAGAAAQISLIPPKIAPAAHPAPETRQPTIAPKTAVATPSGSKAAATVGVSPPISVKAASPGSPPLAALQPTIAAPNKVALGSTTLVELEYDSLSSDITAQRAKSFRDDGNPVACLDLIGTQPDLLSTRTMLRADCEMIAGSCALGTQRLRHLASLAVNGAPDLYFDRWTKDWIEAHDTHYCSPADTSASVKRRIARLHLQAPLPRSQFHGAAFVDAMFALSTTDVLADQRLKTKLFDSYIAQLLRYASLRNCATVDKIVREAQRISLQINRESHAASFMGTSCTANVDPLFTAAPPTNLPAEPSAVPIPQGN